jgi:maltose O-acetyltransferase
MAMLNETPLLWKLCKKTLKMLAKQAPFFKMRASFLRLAGYNIGKHVYIGEDLIIIDELETKKNNLLTIGDRVSLAPRVTLVLSSRSPFRRLSGIDTYEKGPINIEKDAWVGTGVIVMPNVTIGQGAIVGAGSVVTKDILPMATAAGIPAKAIKTPDSRVKGGIEILRKTKRHLRRSK